MMGAVLKSDKETLKSNGEALYGDREHGGALKRASRNTGIALKGNKQVVRGDEEALKSGVDAFKGNEQALKVNLR